MPENKIRTYEFTRELKSRRHEGRKERIIEGIPEGQNFHEIFGLKFFNVQLING